MTESEDFTKDLELEVQNQLRTRRIGYLLGAGSSHLGGKGYPLTPQLWSCIEAEVPQPERDDIQAKLDDGYVGIESALDALDDGGASETLHRGLVTKAIAQHFRGLTPPLDAHTEFVRRLANRSDPHVPVYSLNYDPLVERAADHARERLTDGFVGTDNAYFDGDIFGEAPYYVRGSHKGRRFDRARRPVHLLKLHGSLGWYEDGAKIARRSAYSVEPPDDGRLLMVPPQRRKATDTMVKPYSSLWSRFRGSLAHEDMPLNRLVCIGYGFGDHHVNEVIEPALSRTDFTLLIFAKGLADPVWQHWSKSKSAIVVTEDRCSLFGQTGSGHVDLWDFERLASEV